MNLERDAPNIDRTDQKRVSAFCEIERVALPGIVMNVEHLFVEEHDHPKATFPFHDSRERTSNLTCGYRLSNIQSLVNICKHHLGPNPKVLMLSSLPLVCPSIESRRSVNGFSHLCFEELLPKIFSLRHPLGDDLGPRGRDEKECLAIFGGSKGHSTSMNCHDGLSKGTYMDF